MTVASLTANLDQHRSIIEALSEIDRLLLQSSALEPILDRVLPSIGSVLRCKSASVILVDGDCQDHARAYDFFTDAATKRPLRRLEVDVRHLTEACRQTMCWWTTPDDVHFASFLAPLAESGATVFQLCSLHHDQKVSGFLCVGHAQPLKASVSRGIGVTEFAERLSVVLANHERMAQLHRHANFDALTDLPNRSLFLDRLECERRKLQESGGRAALLYIDLDHFKRINDVEGHSAGDAVLRLVASRIVHCVKATDTVARLGGDEFAVFLAQVPNDDAARQVAVRILDCLSRPVKIDGRIHQLGASIGLARVPEDGDSIEALMKCSDIALYRAKESGRGRVVFFSAEIQDRMIARTALGASVRQAVQNRDFDLAFQPIVCCRSQAVLGVEALLRWPNGPEGEGRSPSIFVPIAEESDAILDLGAWVLATACRQFAAWKQRGLGLRYISINVSARQLKDGALLDTILATLARHAIEPAELQIEITESVLAEGGATDRNLRKLSALGAKLALDDFGTGYSSLNYLRTFPISTLKIDRSFMLDLPGNDGACRLVESIIRMCVALKKEVVAEGVEHQGQFDFLSSLGCGAVQGYLTGRPMMSPDVGRLLSRSPAGA